MEERAERATDRLVAKLLGEGTILFRQIIELNGSPSAGVILKLDVGDAALAEAAHGLVNCTHG